MRRTLLVLVLLAVACPALATDGVLEINQACAVRTGCFPGDTAGLPVTITAPGSYRLTSNLTIADLDTDGIRVSSSDVSIDLNDFAIVGPVTCSGGPSNCTPATPGTGSGVERSSSTIRGLSVENGSVTGMGSYGLFLGEQAEVTNVRARWNLSDGIFVLAGSTVSGNTVYQNGTNGISAGFGSTLTGNTAYQNGIDGIVANTGSTIAGNTTRGNADDGIDCFSGCSILANSSYGNGDGVNPTGDDGIECSLGCLVRENSVRSNAGFGLNLGTDSAYSNNVVTSNTTGQVTGIGSANSRGGNFCSGTGTVSSFCP